MNEVWVKVKGYEMYEISNHGRLRKTYKNGKQRIMKTDKIHGGYLRYTLCKDGTTERFIAHRLVAVHFIENPNNYPDVNHIDNNRTNNVVNNLEWCTPLMNAEHREKQGRNPKCKTVYQYDSQGNLVATYKSTREVARKTGYCKSSVQAWCNDGVKPNNDYIWTYEKKSK